MTSTASPGFEIPAAPSGNFAAVARLFTRRRKDSFLTGHNDRYSSPDRISMDVYNKLAPRFNADPPGTEIARHTTGMGEFVMDPMQALEQKVDVNRSNKLHVGSADSVPSESIRRMGITAYRQVNGS